LKKLFFIIILFCNSFSYSQSYTNFVTGRYNVIIDDANGVTNCQGVLDLVQSSSHPGTVGEIDSCFVNHWVASQPWDMLVNADSSLIGCAACGTATIASVGKLYANDSIHLKVKVFGNQTQWRTFNGFKLYSTVTKTNELTLPENALLISPNPASDIIYIQSSQQNFINQPVLYDVKGAKVNPEINYLNSHTYKVDVSNLPNGIYFVFAQTNEGYLRKKVVISK
jgi:hypothetical protein